MAYNEKTGEFKNVAYVITSSESAMAKIMALGDVLEFRHNHMIFIEKSQPANNSKVPSWENSAINYQDRHGSYFQPNQGGFKDSQSFYQMSYQLNDNNYTSSPPIRTKG
jgi:hypothetical protein